MIVELDALFLLVAIGRPFSSLPVVQPFATGVCRPGGLLTVAKWKRGCARRFYGQRRGSTTSGANDSLNCGDICKVAMQRLPLRETPHEHQTKTSGDVVKHSV